MSGHRWAFVRAGDFDQVQLRDGADLVALPELDQKLWVALACPTQGLELDPRTLALMDADGDGRIRASELLAAIAWIEERIVDVDDLVIGASSIALDRIDDEEEAGELLAKTARAMLASLGKADAGEISVDDASKAVDALAKERWNGDGVVPPESIDDEATRKIAEDVLACTTPADDRSGKKGITDASAKAFFEAIDAHAAWLAKGEGDAAIMPLGEKTAAAWAALDAVRAKVEDWLARARLAAFDARAGGAMNRDEKEYAALATKDLGAAEGDIAALPLALVTADGALPLAKGVNPAWRDRVDALRDACVTPIVGARDALRAEDWKAVREKLAAHAAWIADKKGASVEKLGAARVRALAEPGPREKVAAELAKEAAKKPLVDAVESVERLVRYHRDLWELANNFVSFRDFYARTRPSIFQVGALYLDQRACELCIRVDDAAKHATMAPLANTYLVYCKCTRKGEGDMTIAAAMTAGDVDNLMVGRNGIFYDRKGRDWDATVTKIVDQPISIRQAFWSPYKKALRMLEEQIARRAAEADAAADARMGSAVGQAHGTIDGGAVAVAAPRRPLDVGVVAALGVAVGGITAALGALLSAFFGLGFWMPLGVVGLILAISGPSMAVAFLKLRKRNLGPLLDANGWAVNAQARINVPLGEALTKVAVLPPGSSRDLRDPFEEKRRPWGLYAFLVALLVGAGAWYLGKLDDLLPRAARSTTVLGADAPAAAESEAGDEDEAAPEEAP